jgi:hypothetical protein
MSADRQIADEKFAVHLSGGPGIPLRLPLNQPPYHLEAWLRPSFPTGATLYVDPDFSGLSRRLPHGRYDDMAAFQGNATIGSLEVPPGVCAILFDAPGCKGNVRRISSDTPALTEWSSKVRSLLVLDSFHARQNYAVLHSSANFQGPSAALSLGTYIDTHALGFSPAFADLPPGVEIQVCSKPSLAGESAVIDSSRSADWSKWAGRVQSFSIRLTAARQFRANASSRPAEALVLTSEDGLGIRLDLEKDHSGLRPPSWLYFGRKLNDGHWHHLGFSRTANSFAAYLDGQKIATGPLPAAPSATFQFAHSFRGRIALIRAWDGNFDPDSFRAGRFSLFDPPMPAALRASCRVNDAGTALAELVAASTVALPAGALIVRAHLPVDPMRSSLGQQLSLAMHAHGGQELQKAQQDQQAMVAAAHRDSDLQRPLRQARARLQSRLGAIKSICFLKRPALFFADSPSHAIESFARRDAKLTNPLVPARWAPLPEPISIYAWRPVAGSPIAYQPSNGPIAAALMDDSAKGRNAEYRITASGKLIHVEWDDVNHRALIPEGVLLENAAPDLSPYEFFNRRWSMALDIDRQILYWSDGHFLYRAKIESPSDSPKKKLLPYDPGHRVPSQPGAALPTPVALAVEPKSGDLIWLDANLGRVRRVSFPSGRIHDLYPAPNPRSAIGIDPETGALFWCSEMSHQSDFTAIGKPGLFYSFQDAESNGRCAMQLPVRLDPLDSEHEQLPARPLETEAVTLPAGHRFQFKFPPAHPALRLGPAPGAATDYARKGTLTAAFDASFQLSRGFSLSLWAKLEEADLMDVLCLAPHPAATPAPSWHFKLSLGKKSGSKDGVPTSSLGIALSAQKGNDSYSFYTFPMAATGVKAGDWFHFALSLKGSAVSVFLDGQPFPVELPDPKLFPHELAALPAAVYRAYLGGSPGLAAGLRFWDRPISPAEAASVFAAGLFAAPHLTPGDRLFDPATSLGPAFRANQVAARVSPSSPLRLPRLSLEFPTGITAEFWVKPEEWLPEDGGNLFTVRGSVAATTRRTFYDAHRFPADCFKVPTTFYQLGGWLHVVLAGDASASVWYVNGLPTNGFADPVVLEPDDYAIEVGGFKGLLAVCRFWNRKLSPAEIGALYTAGPGEVPVLTPRDPAAPAAPGSHLPFIMMGDVDGADPCVPFRQMDAQYGLGIESASSKAHFEHVKALRTLHAAELQAEKDNRAAEEQRQTTIAAAQAKRNQDLSHANQITTSKQAETDAARNAKYDEKRQALARADADRADADRRATDRRNAAQQQSADIRATAQARHDEIVGAANQELTKAQSELAAKQREKREKMGG